MGVQISQLLPKQEIRLEDLANKKIAIDAFNIIFQFLSIIRQKDTGEPLRDSKGRITSHLSGLFYRNLKFLEAGIKPIYVFDGEPPKMKRSTIREREAKREEALKKWEQALKEGRKEDVMVYAQASSKLTDEMIDESKKLLKALGIPIVQAPSEGEAQASHMVLKGDAYAAASQDSDSLLFGCPRLIRNLSITGKRKMPRQEKWIDINPELIELENVLKELGITREQLIMIGMLVGTDYNPEGIAGFGPKKALKMVQEKRTLKNLLESIEWRSENDPHEIYNFFLNPKVDDNYEIKFGEIDKEMIKKIMVDEHDFSEDRIESNLNKLLEAKKKGTQSSLAGWFKKS
ncbi:MAG: flap endonuclease-1 [Candidatus Aenigmarchaeota archaeon]|nr:flap endonuclease-1 [Candidatus Aenigmarchaeota archaeon]MBU5689025.1 flap endonuclease-1 [Candidatus Aenigmarchaeota archaeon]